MEVASRTRTGPRRNVWMVAAIAVVVLAAGAWALFDVRLLDESPADLSYVTSPCANTVAPTADHGALSPIGFSGLTASGTLRVYGNHLNYRRYELLLPGGEVVPLRESEPEHLRHPPCP